MKKWAVITGVIILLAAGAFTWWYAARRAELALMPYWTGEYPDWAPESIEEPPISEQIEAQIASIETGDDVPLPIPLYIAGERIDSLEFDWLREKLKSLGYVEKRMKNERHTKVGFAYAHPEYREMLILKSLSPRKGNLGLIVFTVFSKSDRQYSDISEYAPALNVAGDKVGVLFGRIHIGIPLSEVEGLVESVPHYGFDMNEFAPKINLLTMKYRDWKMLFQRKMNGRIWFINFKRGKHSYSLIFRNGILINIMAYSNEALLKAAASKRTAAQNRRVLERSFR